eukprot:6180494-Pleurochrysis_carterae.AAC.2
MIAAPDTMNDGAAAFFRRVGRPASRCFRVHSERRGAEMVGNGECDQASALASRGWLSACAAGR